MSPPLSGRQAGQPAPTVDGDHTLDELTREQLISLIEAQQEAGVRISFAGKANARRLARRVRPRVQRTVKKYSIGTPEEQASNLLVEGDNLQALVTLYKQRGKVDLILTDPPYNTGKDFRYNDRWEEDPNDPGIGEFVSSDDAGRHTKWMRFMLPRLRMMKSMLKPGGVLAICIDHRELFHLGQMLDELFGDKNRIAIINWQRAATRRNDKGGGVSTSTEYVLVYARDREKATTGLEPRGDAGFSNPDSDPNGDWIGVGPWAPDAPGHKHMVYAVQSPFTGRLEYPPGNQCWKLEKKAVKRIFEEWGTKYEERDLDDGKAKALLLKGAEDPRHLDEPLQDPVVAKARARAEKVALGVLPELYFTKSGEGRPRRKTYLSRVKKGYVPTTYWADDGYDDVVDLGSTSWDNSESGTSEAGSRELSAVIGDTHGFETVKPLKLFQKIIQIWCPADGLILDPFAGSGTTGHAVLALNEESGASRNFVLIEQGRPEKGDSYARTLLAERMRRVVTGKWQSGAQPAVSGGFRFVTLDQKVDAEALLHMERDEMVDTVVASHSDSSQRRAAGLVTVESSEYRYLVAKNADQEGFFLVWGGADENTDFTEDVYETCAEEAKAEGLRPVYHVYARFNTYQTDNVRFYQIPDRILADFGLDIRSEPFAQDTE